MNNSVGARDLARDGHCGVFRCEGSGEKEGRSTARLQSQSDLPELLSQDEINRSERRPAWWWRVAGQIWGRGHAK
jgi:hypothetical protein